MQSIENLDIIRNLKKEYLLKKDRILQRLKDFDRFYNESYSWFFDNNVMNLKKVVKNDDERIIDQPSHDTSPVRDDLNVEPAGERGIDPAQEG